MKFAHLLLSLTFVCTWLLSAQDTYSIGNTEYYTNQTYSTTAKPRVKRSAANKSAFLQSQGYDQTPYGYEIDHIVPLSKGGSDDPSNMQLLSVRQHKAKTARERASTSSYSGASTPLFSSYSSTTTSPSYYSTSTSKKDSRTYYTGARGGQYYYNANGNKTYVKKSSSATYVTPKKATSFSTAPTYKTNSSRTLQTGARGGTYYINSNGNKTYVKKN